MRILLIKTSSMGDLIHTLPALTDLSHAVKDVTVDWVVEDAFAEIPHWHPLVEEVIPVALRRWRKGLLASVTRSEWQALRRRLSKHHYDLILDAQGLVKSAFLSFFAKGVRAGLDFRSARESFASLAYQRKYRVNFYQHAIVRMRQLFSQAFEYPLPASPPEFNLNRQQFQQRSAKEPYVVFLHGTTWDSKQWPESYWRTLANFAKAAGIRVKIGGGSEEEVNRAQRIAGQNTAVDVVPYLNIVQMAHLLAGSKAVIAVDTGFGHLAAALNVPTISLYGSTNPKYTGALGQYSIHLTADFPCSPCLQRTCTYKNQSTVTPACYETIAPTDVWKQVITLIHA